MRRLRWMGLVLLLVLLSACGAFGGAFQAPEETRFATKEVESLPVERPPASLPAEKAVGGMPMPTPPPAPVAERRPGPGEETGAPAGANLPPLERMIIKNAQIVLEVDDTSTAIGQLEGLAAAAGGYVQSVQTHSRPVTIWTDEGPKEEERLWGSVVLVVPADQFEVTLQRLRQMGRQVVAESVSSQEVTEEYVDLQARVRNLEETIDRLRTFLDQAKTVTEALQVDRELRQLEAERERLLGRMRYLEQRSAFSTIAVELQPYVPPPPTPTPTPTPTSGWDPGQTAGQAWSVLKALLIALANLAIWVGIVLGPFAAVGVLAYVAWKGTRRSP